MFLLNIVEGRFISSDGSNILTNFNTDILPRENDEITIKESADAFIVTKVLIDFRSYQSQEETIAHVISAHRIRVFVFVDNTGFARFKK